MSLQDLLRRKVVKKTMNDGSGARARIRWFTEHLPCRADWLFVPVLLVMVAIVAWAPNRVNHDVALYLYAGQILTDGKLMYIDFITGDQPEIFYLSALPSFIARFLGIGCIPVFLLSMVLLIAWSSFTIGHLLSTCRLSVRREEIGILLFFWTLFSMQTLLYNEFGQREHLMVVLLVPWLAVRSVRWQGGTVGTLTAVLTGCAGALGSCIKPYFLLVPVACELFCLLNHRKVKMLVQPETIVFVATGIGYCLHFLLLPDAITTAYFKDVVPLFFKTYPQTFRVPLGSLLWAFGRTYFCWIALVAAPWLLKPTRTNPVWGMASVFSAMAIAGGIICFIQQKGFWYHAIPMLAGAWLILGVLCAESKLLAFTDAPSGSGRFTVRMKSQTACLVTTIAVLGILAGAVGHLLAHGLEAPTKTTEIELLEKYSRWGDPVLVISTSVSNFPAVLQTGRRLGSRWPGFGLISSFYSDSSSESGKDSPYRSRERISAEEKRLLSDLETDIKTFNPVVILVYSQEGGQSCPPGFTMLGYLTRMGVIKGVMNKYRWVERRKQYDVFVLTDRDYSR